MANYPNNQNASSRATIVNASSPATIINNGTASATLVNAKSTLVNAGPGKTGDALKKGVIEIEEVPGGVLNLRQGDQLFADSSNRIYAIDSRIGQAKDSGEADVYLCVCDRKHYVAKIFRRKMKLKPELIKKLMSLDSGMVARLIDTGTVNGRHFEIFP